MVPFAGYDMPVQYPTGVMKEHLHTRASAGLFDVSHMGQIIVKPHSGNLLDAALALEALIPVDIAGLEPGRQRYGLLTNDTGGILDDLMIANRGDHLFLVVNAGCKDADFQYLSANLAPACSVTMLDRALVALQGPRAEAVLSELWADVSAMRFMDVVSASLHDVDCVISRSGYTGEDGFEISMPLESADTLTRLLLEHPDVLPIGLGARDSLRLEAGLCLYGHDIDETTSPVEANLKWAMQRVRRSGGDRAGGFPGADRILHELNNQPSRTRVGLKPDGKAPVREGAPLYADAKGDQKVGVVTSGGFGPSVGHPIAMGYVATAHRAEDTQLFAEVRGKYLPVTVTALPFITPNYKR